MAELDKVIKGLEHCQLMTSNITFNPCYECPYKGNYSCADILKTDALELLKEQEADKWIPVSERLPKNMANKVIVYLQHEDLVPYIGYGHYEKFHGEEMWYDLENGEQFSKRGYTVTHWMETPIPPMEGR